MLIRVATASVAALLLGCLAWWLGGRTEPALESAADLRGERWYRLLLENRPVGYLHTHIQRDALGRWVFDSDLRFVLSLGAPVRTEERLVFSAYPPYRLLDASQRSERPGAVEGTRLEARSDGYLASRITKAGGGAAQAVDLDFTLADYLGFETWLRESQPQPGATIAASALDLPGRRVVPRRFRVVERNVTGYQIENAAPLEASRIQLDQHLRPVAMTLAGLFQLVQSSRAEALAPRGSGFGAASYLVPADRPLRDHTEIRELELEVEGGLAASDLWPELASGGARMRQAAASVSSPRLLGDELAETADHPTSDPRIRALAREAVAGITGAAAQVDALTRFVNGYLRYADDGGRRHVLTLLDDPVGDCSEYADLLTTLARSLDIPSRTIFGLAYADERPPAFRFHAWNELLVDGEWRAVDPTWNQLRIDATHIPMPANAGHALGLLTGGLDIRFVIRDVEYF